jgi:hypothetical protein
MKKPPEGGFFMLGATAPSSLCYCFGAGGAEAADSAAALRAASVALFASSNAAAESAAGAAGVAGAVAAGAAGDGAGAGAGVTEAGGGVLTAGAEVSCLPHAVNAAAPISEETSQTDLFMNCSLLASR